MPASASIPTNAASATVKRVFEHTAFKRKLGARMIFERIILERMAPPAKSNQDTVVLRAKRCASRRDDPETVSAVSFSACQKSSGAKGGRITLLLT
jgi:hypothetical protein